MDVWLLTLVAFRRVLGESRLRRPTNSTNRSAVFSNWSFVCRFDFSVKLLLTNYFKVSIVINSRLCKEQ